MDALDQFLDSEAPIKGAADGGELDAFLDAPVAAAPTEKTWGGTLVSAAKAGAVGGVQTIMEVIDPTPLWGMERIDTPLKPDFTKDKKAAAQIIDKERGNYKEGLAGQVTGYVTEAVANPTSYVMGVGTKAKAGLKAATSGGAKLVNTIERGAIQGFSTGVGENDSRAANTAVGGLSAGAGQAAVAGTAKAVRGAGKAIEGTKGAVKTIKTGANARLGDSLQKAAEGLKNQSSKTYEAMRSVGAVLTGDAMQKVVTKVDDAIQGAGKTNATIHSKTLSALSDLRDAAQRGALSLEELDQFRQLFRGAASGFDDDARRAAIGIEAIDDAVRSIGKSDLQAGTVEAAQMLQTARKQWAQKSKFDVVAELVQKGEGDPQRTKTMAKNLLANKKKMRGWTAAEKGSLQQLANRGGVNGMLKLAGSFGFDNTSVMRNVVAGGTAALGGPVGWAASLAGTGARQLEKLLGRGQAENLLQLIEKGANPDEIARAVSGQSTNARRAAKAMEIIGKSAPAQGVREQFAKLAEDATLEAPKIARAPGKGTTLSARPEATIAGLTLAGGLGAANFGSSLATNTQYDAPPTRSEQRAFDTAATMSQDTAEPLPDASMSDAPQELIQAPANDNQPQSSISDALVDKIIGIESGGRADAKNPLSSATGKGQFIASTWLGMVKKYRPELLEGRSKAEVLSLRKDPYVSRYMVQKYAEDNANVLKSAGVPVSDSNIYLSHFLDGKTAAKLLKADPGIPAIRIVGKEAVKANPSVLKGKRVSDVIAWAQRKTSGK